MRGRDAGKWIVLATVAMAGCATPERRESARSSNPPPESSVPPAVQPAAFQAPESPPKPTTDSDPLTRLAHDAEQACAECESYICRLRRRENLPGKQKPEEVLIFKFRARPFSVHFKWLGDMAQGREVAYSAGRGEKLHILTAAGDIPFTPAGRRLDLPVDSALVRSASKYPITEAGICRTVARFRRMLDDSRRGAPGLSIRYVGPVQRPEFPKPVEIVEVTFPPHREPEAPQGGRRVLGFDPTTKWPVLSITYDVDGREIDYYCFDRFQLNVRLDDDDFDPDTLWPVKNRKE